MLQLMPLSLMAISLAVASTALGATFTLERAVSTAVENSPDARIAESRLASADAMLMQAGAAFQPRVGLQSSYVGTNEPVSVFGFALNQRSFSQSLNFNDVPSADNWNTKGLVTMPLYAGGKNVAARDAARSGVEAAKLGAEATEQVLAYQTGRTWLMAHKAGALIQAAESAVAALEGNAKLAQARLDGGSGLKADVLDLGVRVAQAKEDLVRIKNARSLALQALKNLMGMEEGEVEITSSAPSLGVPSTSTAPQRPELAAAEEMARAAEFGIRRAKAGWKPSVQAFGSVDHNRGAQFDGDGTNYTAGVMVQWDLWDGKLTKGRVAQAEAEVQQAREEARKLRLGIDLEVQQSRLALTEATERMKVTEKTIALAQESVELTRQRYEQGSALASQLIDAETALTGARVRAAEAAADRLIAIATLRRALGLPLTSSSK
jgi:outer membrane protein TolC